MSEQYFSEERSRIKLVVYFNDRKDAQGFPERQTYYNYSNTNRRETINIINGMISRILKDKLKHKYSTAIFYENKQYGKQLHKLRGTI